MLNIMAWSDVRKRYRITADTDIENSISVHMKDGTVIKFEAIASRVRRTCTELMFCTPYMFFA